VFHEALNCNIGALVDDSCFKMLHCYLRPKGTPLSKEEACALNICTAAREWFNHGPNVYEMRRKQMIEIAEKHGLMHMCETLHQTYEDMAEEWKLAYA
jgi:hypothetical protein